MRVSGVLGGRIQFFSGPFANEMIPCISATAWRPAISQTKIPSWTGEPPLFLR